jgi:hypothetical protein
VISLKFSSEFRPEPRFSVNRAIRVNLAENLVRIRWRLRIFIVGNKGSYQCLPLLVYVEPLQVNHTSSIYLSILLLSCIFVGYNISTHFSTIISITSSTSSVPTVHSTISNFAMLTDEETHSFRFDLI